MRRNRVLHRAFLTLYLALCLAASGAYGQALFTLGPVSDLYTDAQIHKVHSALNRNANGDLLTIDASMATMRESNGMTAFYIGNFNATDKFLSVSASTPLANPQWQEGTDYGRDDTELWDCGTFDAHEDAAWITNMYKISEDEYLGFVHVETNYVFDACDNWIYLDYSIGIAYSDNGGDTWTYCGDVITPEATSVTGVGCTTPGGPPVTPPQLPNVHGVPYLIRDGMLYLYYYEYSAAFTWVGTAVARAPLSNVIADAQSSTVDPTDWRKRSSTGAWNEPGLGGLGARLPGIWSNSRYPQGDATYCSAADQYLLLLSDWNSGNVVRLYRSNDGITWSSSGVGIVAPAVTGTVPSYSWFTPATHDAADDGSTVGREFYVTWTRMDASDPHSETIQQRKLTVNSPVGPSAAVRAAALTN